jgi:hypothetical protein
VEIGVWHGVTSSLLRSVMAPEGVLFAVDPFPTGRLGVSLQRIIAHREVARRRNGTVRWVLTTGVEAGRQFAEERSDPVDFIFIDGDHSYEGLRGDWTAWSDLVAPSGIVALHDSRSCPTRQIDNAGSARFSREVILRDPRFELIESVDTLSVLRRKAA